MDHQGDLGQQVTHEPRPIQPPTLRDVDLAMIRRALFEIIGLSLFALAALLVWIRNFGLERLGDGAIAVAVLELCVLGASFIFKEPAIEKIAKAIIAQVNRPRPVNVTKPAVDIYVKTTNVANDDYNCALAALEASLKQLGKLRDGETLKTKPWSKRALVDAKIVKDDWRQWSRVISVWERAGVIENRDAKELKVETLAHGRTLINTLMQNDGYVLINNIWMKR